MTARSTLKLDNRNLGGIAKEFRRGVNFRLVYMQDGEVVEGIHNDADESVPALRKRLGLTPEELLCEPLR
jgi:hypothetical protein